MPPGQNRADSLHSLNTDYVDLTMIQRDGVKNGHNPGKRDLSSKERQSRDNASIISSSTFNDRDNLALDVARYSDAHSTAGAASVSLHFHLASSPFISWTECREYPSAAHYRPAGGLLYVPFCHCIPPVHRRAVVPSSHTSRPFLTGFLLSLHQCTR